MNPMQPAKTGTALLPCSVIEDVGCCLALCCCHCGALRVEQCITAQTDLLRVAAPEEFA